MDDIVLIAMGDLIRRKNYSASIDALARLNNPKLHFLICGEGPEIVSLKERAKKHGIENQVHFLGFRDDIKKLLGISDIFLFTTHQEGLPRALMEAMAAGLPCVVSRVRGNVDLIENGKGGFLHDPDDIDGFAFSINTLVQDVRLRQEMGKNNIERIKD